MNCSSIDVKIDGVTYYDLRMNAEQGNFAIPYFFTEDSLGFIRNKLKFEDLGRDKAIFVMDLSTSANGSSQARKLERNGHLRVTVTFAKALTYITLVTFLGLFQGSYTITSDRRVHPQYVM